MPCSLGRIRIDFFEITQHRFDRAVQAVEIHAENTCPLTLGLSGIPLTQPFHKFDHDAITPHPRREPTKITERLRSPIVLRSARDIAMNAKPVRPVSLVRE